MRSRSRDSTSAFWCGEARLVKGKSARLRARRMRVETTTSDSGPVPPSQSPVVGIRLSRFIRGFPFSDQVAQPRGLLVVLDRQSRPQPLLQPLALRPPAGVLGQPPRRLADVARRVVDLFQD